MVKSSKTNGAPKPKKPNPAKTDKAKTVAIAKGNVLRKPDSTKVMALRWKHRVNNNSVRAIANAFCQAAATTGYLSAVSDSNANDLIDTYIVINQEIYRAMGGHIYLLQKHPEQLRAIMDGVFPTVGKSGKLSASFDPESFDHTITEFCGVHWGRTDGEYGSTGCVQVESPALPSATEELRLAAAARVFEKMEQAGYAMVLRTQPTQYLNTADAFSYFIPGNELQDFVTEAGEVSTGLIGNEEEIRHLWLAALRLAEPGVNRMTMGKHFKVYAPPSAYIGHRLFQRHTGNRGRMDNIRLQSLSIADEVIIQGSMCDEINNKFGQSAVAIDVAPPFLNGDSKAFQAYVQMAVQTQFFNESPVGLGLKREIPGSVPQVSLKYGSQFRERGNTSGAALKMFWLPGEILRRLHFDVYKDETGQVNYTYNIPVVDRDPPVTVAYPETWDAGVPVFPPSFDPAEFHDGNIVVCNTDTVYGSYSEYLDVLVDQINTANPFTQNIPVQKTFETVRGQHLTRLTRVVAFVDPQMLRERALGGSTVKARNAALNLKMVEDGQRRGLKNHLVRERFPSKTAVIEGGELEIGLIAKVPQLEKVLVFFGVNLPQTASPLGGAESLNEAVSFAANKLNYDSYSNNKSVRPKLPQIILTYRESIKARSDKGSSSDLVKVLHSKEDRGLGGLFGKLGVVADGIVGAFFPDSKINAA